MTCSVCVVGSVNMDLVVRAPRLPHVGETLLGESFEMHPGGKGANQAVAASRMGASVRIVGCVGDDDWGSRMRSVFAAEGLDLHGLRTVEKTHTGVGFVHVLPGAQSAIVVAPGANAKLSAADVDASAKAIEDADVLMLQGEVPVEANVRALEIAARAGVKVVLNAAPAGGVPAELLRRVQLLVVNEIEARELVKGAGDCAPAGLARRLASLGPERVVVTLGREGGVRFNGEEVATFDAFEVEALDATAAGDAFVATLAVLRAEGMRLAEAVRHASAAGALATTGLGAIPSLPTREAVEALVSSTATAG
jgi:ribokinase